MTVAAVSTAMNLDFVVVGPQRTATTWLDGCLRQHTSLCLPMGTKETFFWDRNFDRGPQWYWAHFTGCKPSSLRGEVASTYFHTPEVAERLYAHNPRLKVLVMLRNPAHRARSLYQHLRRIGRIKAESPVLAVDRFPDELGPDFYRRHLDRWRALFPTESLHYILLDDVERDPTAVMAALFRFLGVPEQQISGLESRVNPGAAPRNYWLARLLYGISWNLRRAKLYPLVDLAKQLGGRRLVYGRAVPESEPDSLDPELFRPDIEYIEELLGRSLPTWREGL